MAKLERKIIKLVIALGIYAVCVLVATFALDGIMRTVLWLFFLVLAIRTVIAAKTGQTMD